jgi:hypothetical protein
VQRSLSLLLLLLLLVVVVVVSNRHTTADPPASQGSTVIPSAHGWVHANTTQHAK